MNMELSMAHMKLHVNTAGMHAQILAVVLPSNLQIKSQMYYSQNGLMMIQAKFGGDPMNSTLAVSNLLVH